MRRVLGAPLLILGLLLAAGVVYAMFEASAVTNEVVASFAFESSCPSTGARYRSGLPAGEPRFVEVVEMRGADRFFLAAPPGEWFATLSGENVTFAEASPRPIWTDELLRGWCHASAPQEVLFFARGDGTVTIRTWSAIESGMRVA